MIRFPILPATAAILVTALSVAGADPAPVPGSARWTVFAGVDLTRTAPIMAELPARLPGVDGRPVVPVAVEAVKLKSGCYKIDFRKLAPQRTQLKTAAMAFQVIDAPAGGKLYFGSRPDWWMNAFLNGKKLFPEMRTGDGNVLSIPPGLTSFAAADLRPGRNLLQVNVLAGRNGWNLIYQFLPPEEYRRLTSYRLPRLLWKISSPAVIPAVKSVNPRLPLSDQTDRGRWTPVPACSDEFNQPELDQTKWDKHVPSWGSHWSWGPEQVTLDRGDLCLTMKYHPHHRDKAAPYYLSGIVRSKAAPVKYGYFEARIKGSRPNPGTCPAFWAYRNDTKAPQPCWTEIDFVELGQGGWAPDPGEWQPGRIDQFVHVFRLPDMPKPVNGIRLWKCNTSGFNAPWDPADDYHVYGCEWTPKTIAMYVDGVKTSELENLWFHQPLDLALSLGLRLPYRDRPTPEGFPAVMRVDYIRVWQQREAK